MDDATAAQIADEVFAAAPQIATVPGIAYGLVRDGELVHVHGRGAASTGGPVPDGDTVFRIASMTKSFTAATVLLLRDEGALRLDDPLTDVLPWTATMGALDGPSITIRDLLTMGSGLATDDPWGDRQESVPAPEFDAMVAAGLSFCRPARMAFEYSNTGYALLGRVIEEVTGTAYAEVVRSRVLAPLGMPDTGYDPRVIPEGRRATGYRIASDGTSVAEPLVTPGAYSAMGGLLSTVQDLSAWVGGFQRSWHDGAPGHPVDGWSLREAQEMARYASTDAGVGSSVGTAVTGYGFGLMVQEHAVLGRVVSHSGGYPGFGSHMRWHPASGWGIIALGNATYAPMSVPATEVLARLVQESGASHGAKPPIAPSPWPQTLAAMDLAEDLLAGRDGTVTDENWSPNMDLDVPRGERMAALADVRDAVGASRRVPESVEHPTPAKAVWNVDGDAGTARLEVWLSPEGTPRVQKLTAARKADTG